MFLIVAKEIICTEEKNGALQKDLFGNIKILQRKRGWLNEKCKERKSISRLY